MASSLPILLALSSLSTLSAAYTWNFDSPPRQCSNLTVSVMGSGGVPPYRLLVLPNGPTPLSSGVEVRRILDVPFPAGSNSVSFQLKYPASSQLVAVVSDSIAFGSGGTSVAAEVITSSDASCFNATTIESPDFVFSIEPANQIVQCVNTRIWWDNSTVQGTPNFFGVIPGGQSFAIPNSKSNITNVDSQGTGFSWKPSIRAGTTLILVGGDDRGNGSAGSTANLVSAGIQNDISCLSDSSPSSTAGDPAGGSYPTSASSVGGNWTGGGGKNIGAIVGGVIGSIVFILACVTLLWIFRRRQKSYKRQKKLPTDILDADDDDEDGPQTVGQNELPQNYQPEPYMVPIPETTPSEYGDEYSTTTGRPFSPGTHRTSFYTRSDTPDPASNLGMGIAGGESSVTGRKGGAPRPMRAVNIIQHQDAGPSNNGDRGEEPVETIELPPAYTMVRTGPGAATSGDGGDGPPTMSTGN